MAATAVVLASSACSDGGTSVRNAETEKESQPGKTTIEGPARPSDSDIGVRLVDQIAKSHFDRIVGDRECIADVLSKVPDEDIDSLSDFYGPDPANEDFSTPGALAASYEFNVRCFLDDTYDSGEAERWLSLSGDEVCAVLPAEWLQALWYPDEFTFTAEPGQSGVCNYVQDTGDRTTLSVLDHYVAPEADTYPVTSLKGFSVWFGPMVYRAMRGDVTFELRLGIDMDAVHARDDTLQCVGCEFTPDQSRVRRFTVAVAEGLRVLPPG